MTNHARRLVLSPCFLLLLAGGVQSQIQFTAFPFLATSQYTGFARTGDLNGDGLLDLVVGSQHGETGPTLSIFLGDGDDGFTLHGSLPVDGAELQLLDYSGDGILDLAIVDGDPAFPIELYLYPGDGTGGFGGRTVIGLAGTEPQALIAEDVNGDGRLDLVIGYHFHDRMGVLLADGNGGFLAEITSNTLSSQPSGIVAGDFNEDSHLDLAVTFYQDGFDPGRAVRIFLGDSSGSFVPSVVLFAQSFGPASIDAGDLNDDGHLDVAFTSEGSPAIGALNVYFGDGTGAFPTNHVESFPFEPSHVAIAPMDGDTIDDLIVSGGGASSVYRGTATGIELLHRFPSASRTPRGGEHYRGETVDLNSDGHLDLVIPGRGTSIHLGDGTGHFLNGPDLVAELPCLVDLHVGDFNGDDLPDLVATRNSIAFGDDCGDAGLSVLIHRSRCATGPLFLAPRDVAVGTLEALAAVAIDVNGDGLDDLACTSESTLEVLVNDGDGSSFTPSSTRPLATDSRLLIPADLNGDPTPDLLVSPTRFGSNEIRALVGNGDGTFTTSAVFSNGGVTNITVADMDGDSVQDLVITANNGLRLRFGNGSGQFSGSRVVNAITSDTLAKSVVDDFDGDGRADIAVADWFNRVIHVLRAEPSGSFVLHQTLTTLGARGLLLVDLDEDGRKDLLLHGSGVSLAFLRDAQGEFHAAGEFVFASGIFTQRAAVLIDADLDGSLDLAGLDRAGEDRIQLTLNLTSQLPAYTCRAGNVGQDGETVLFLNGTPGEGVGRTVHLAQGSPLHLRLENASSRGLEPSRYVVFAWAGCQITPSLSTVTPFGFGVGSLCLPVESTSQEGPFPRRRANTFGHVPLFGATDWPQPIDLAPTDLLTVPAVNRSVKAFFQAIVEDTDSAQGQVAVSNGILLCVE